MIAKYYNQIRDDDLMPQESRNIYLRELQLQGDSLELARYRLGQSLAGLREQRAFEIFRGEINKPWVSELYNHAGRIGPLPSMTRSIDSEKVCAMLMGIAIGDALGAPTEGILPTERRRNFGTINGYFARQDIQATDDSQMAFVTLDLINRHGLLVPGWLIDAFSGADLRGTGNTVLAALQKYRQGNDWQACGVNNVGNGALMRIAPVILPYIKAADTRSLWRDVVSATVVTHRSYGAVAASIAYVEMLWNILRTGSLDPVTMAEKFACTVDVLEKEGEAFHARAPRVESGKLSSFCRLPLNAYYKSVSAHNCSTWYSGAYLPETLPSMLYILMHFSDDPHRAILSAVNDTKDNDTVASLVAAVMGALHGMDAFKGEWVENLTGDLYENGDRLMLKILQKAEKKWL